LDDPVVQHAFSHGFHPDHLSRLATYWSEALGGPADFSRLFGSESEVVRTHSGNGEHAEMDERAQVCFALALDDIGLEDDRLRATLKAYFAFATHLSVVRSFGAFGGVD
jgi:hemoglobin